MAKNKIIENETVELEKENNGNVLRTDNINNELENIKLKDEIYNVSHKRITYFVSLIVAAILYIAAFILMYKVFCFIEEKELNGNNWLLLTYSVIVLSFPVIIHFNLINKLYSTKNEKNQTVLDHPLLDALARLITAAANKLNR